MVAESLVSVRERLERLKSNPRSVPRPLDIIPERERKPIAEGTLTSDKILQQKMEKVIKDIECVKDRMRDSETFTSLFYDLKKLEKELLDLLATAEEKRVEFPDSFVKRLEAVKAKIRPVKP